MLDAHSARATSSAAHGVHPSARPRLARRYETLLEALRDGYREARAAWSSFAQAEGAAAATTTMAAVDKALEGCIGSCGAALALARQRRSDQEAGRAFARGRTREGTGALASGWSSETGRAASFLALLNASPAASAPSVPYAEALESAVALRDWQGTEARLREQCATLQAQLDAVTAEKERIAEQWARTTDLLRQQRAAMAKAEAATAMTSAAPPPVDAASPAPAPAASAAPELEAHAVPEGSWRVRRVPGAGTGDDDDDTSQALLLRDKTRALWEQRVARSEAEAAKWQHAYSDLVAAAQRDRAERAALRDNVARTEAQLKSWNEDKDALHRGYQEQLLVLNDHLIKQTELISAKDNEITVLQNNRVRCVTCHGWNTVGWLMANGQGKRCQFGQHVSGLNYAPK